MNKYNNAPSIEESKKAINSLDFTMIKKKLTHPEPDPNIAILWTDKAFDEAVIYYKNFLWLLRKYHDKYEYIPPSIEIDEIWHHHILDTTKYHKDMDDIFGEYLHHFPYFGMRNEQDKKDLQDAFNITQSLYINEFGESLKSFILEDN